MSTIITRTVNGSGPYKYRVTYENGSHTWTYLGRAADVDVDAGPVTNGTGRVLEGQTRNVADTAVGWGENRAVIKSTIDADLREKIKSGEELTHDEAVKAEIALRAFAADKQKLADADKATIMGDPESHEQWAESARDAADDINTGDAEVEDVLRAREMKVARDETAGQIASKTREFSRRASEADISLAPDEAIGDVGLDTKTLDDGTAVRGADADSTVDDEIPGGDTRQDTGSDTGSLTDDEVNDALDRFGEVTPDKKHGVREAVQDVDIESGEVLSATDDRAVYRSNTSTRRGDLRNILEEQMGESESLNKKTKRTGRKKNSPQNMTYGGGGSDSEDEDVDIEELEREFVEMVNDIDTGDDE